MRIAYADPPYPGTAHRYPEKKEVNHRLLIAHLQEFDGWALSSSSPSLRILLPLCPEKTRIGAYVKPMGYGCRVIPGVTCQWEPVLFIPARRKWGFRDPDWVKAPTVSNGFTGAKPFQFCAWVFHILGAEPSDEFVDLFPGSGAVTRAWEAWKRQTILPLEFSRG